MLAATTAALLMAAQAGPEWPDLVQFHCRFSDVFTVARRDEPWAVVTDLRVPAETVSLAFNTQSGAWSLWTVRDRGPYMNGATIGQHRRSLSISYSDSETYDPELPADVCEQGVLGCDAP